MVPQSFERIEGAKREVPNSRIRYPKHQFSGSQSEAAYLLGLRAGDVSVSRNSRNTVRARISTTHPAMADLFETTFGKYGRCNSAPDEAFLPGHYCWKLAVCLDNTFEFLLAKPRSVAVRPERFYSFLAGYSDSEACWCVYSDKGHPAVAFVIESKDEQILKDVVSGLSHEGFHPLWYRNPGGEGKFRVELRRKAEVVSLAQRLSQLSKHREKIAKMLLVRQSTLLDWNSLCAKVIELRLEIHEEVAKYVGRAERYYKKANK